MDFNTAEFAWKDIEVVMLGRPIVRLLEVKYKVTKETKEIYGRGQNPLGIQEGNKKYEGEIKIGQSELEALINKAQQITPGGDPTDLPQFNVAISYEKNGILRTDILIGVKLQEFEKGMKQGDSDMEVTLPIKCLGIQYNA